MPPTPHPPLRVVPATDTDCPTLAHIYRLSFLPNSLGQALFGRADPDAVASRLEERFRRLLAHPQHAIFKAVRPGPGAAGDGDAEAVLGFAWWELPRPAGEESGAESEEEVKREFGEGVDVELVEAFFADLEAHARTIEGRHFHLHMLGTDPQYQRTGAGSALVRWGMAEADAEGVALHLDATDEGIPLYEYLGFERCGEPIWVRDRSAAVWPMVYRHKKV